MRLVSAISSRVGCSRCCRRTSPPLATRSPLVGSSRFQSTRADAPYHISGQTYPRDSYSNTPSAILSKLDRKLLHVPSHPLYILRNMIESHFAQYTPSVPSSPVVTVAKNFDELGFAPDHPGRALSDSYYINKEYMLRTHTSAHEVEEYASGKDAWVLSADVYRRDEIDKSHYPVFHQMEGTHVWPTSELYTLPELNAYLASQLEKCPLIIEDTTQISPSNPYQPHHDPVHAAQIAQHLKHSLNSMIFKLFGPIATKDGEPLRVRWIEAFFPFTTPSYEVEVWWNGEWLELLGCGVVMQKTLDVAGVSDKAGWAFGLGLERLAMVLFSIPDIRLFWSEDKRFLNQFADGGITTFKPYSKYPPCYRDMSFWIPDAPVTDGGSAAGGLNAEHGVVTQGWHENDYCEIVREVAGDLVETVEKIDEFTHPKSGKKSKTFRLNYRSMDRSLSNEEVNVLQEQVQKRVVNEMGIQMR